MDCGRYQAVNWDKHGGWGHHRGGFFFPLIGLFILFAIFKTGLWVPLLFIGLFFWMTRHHRHHFHEFRQHGMWEKRKHMPMWGDVTEKPKHDEYI
jgi:hypothetical protein